MAQCIHCGDFYPDERLTRAGYETCFTCGDAAARETRMGWCIVPLPKQGYTRVTQLHELKQLNQKVR